MVLTNEKNGGRFRSRGMGRERYLKRPVPSLMVKKGVNFWIGLYFWENIFCKVAQKWRKQP
jgi:hypothetical protein